MAVVVDSIDVFSDSVVSIFVLFCYERKCVFATVTTTTTFFVACVFSINNLRFTADYTTNSKLFGIVLNGLAVGVAVVTVFTSVSCVTFGATFGATFGWRPVNELCGVEKRWKL